MSNIFSEQEVERYKSHILLDNFGGVGQQKLKSSKVLIIGAGGLGCPVSLYLVAVGVGMLGIIDDDLVAFKNLQSQIAFNEHNVGKAKSQILSQNLSKLNSDIIVTCYNERLSELNAKSIITDYDIIIDCSDNITTRMIANDACYFFKKTLICGDVGKYDGQISSFQPYLIDKVGMPYSNYRDIMPHKPEDEPLTCQQIGILGALTGIIGSLMALEAIKIITEIGENQINKIMIYDSLDNRYNFFNIKHSPKNPLTGEDKTIQNYF